MSIKLWSKKHKSTPNKKFSSVSTKSGPIPPGIRAKPRLKSLNIDYDRQLTLYPWNTGHARLELYRFLRDNIPMLNAVIWTWVRLCSARFDYQISGVKSEADEQAVRSIMHQLDLRIYRNGLLKRGGFRELLLQFFESLFTDGAVCGELQLSPSQSSIDRFLLADMRSIVIEPNGEEHQVLQEIENHRTALNPASTFYYGLGAQPGSVTGKSLLAAIPFVARVEQTLVNDMYRSMRSAGYHRIHVKITPPEKRSEESDADYVVRANNYFDDTVEMMRDFGPDKNPVTWNDVAIEYIGPSNRSSSATAWYMNHKSMIEDVCAGTHLAPFMLGYAYGTTHNWAEFKYELVQRQVATVQNAAASLLNWIANVELALHGISAEVQFRFENRAHIGLTERAQAEKIQLENIITKMTNNLITREEAINELARLT